MSRKRLRLSGHPNVHEAGAIEFSGHKVLTIPQHNGKMVENSVTSGTPAPMLPHNVRLISHEAYDGNVINTYERM